MQLVEWREYAASRGWQVIGEYVDHGVSGSKESRPALNRLMSDARQRKFDILLVWKIDRFEDRLNIL
jgi:DNA invertase Pin-like site-specific DNA recombinase